MRTVKSILFKAKKCQLLVIILIGFCSTQAYSAHPGCIVHHIPADSAGMFNNIIRNGADPWVIKDGGYYYGCFPSHGGIGISRSKDLSKVGPVKVVWKLPKTGWNKTCLWAPELHHIGNRWYVYYAAGESGPPFIHQRSGVLESVSNDPLGEYVDKGMLSTGSDPNDSTGTIWAIDLTVDKINGQLYAVWSGWDHNEPDHKTPQLMYIAKMSNPWTISSERVKLSQAEEPWETGGPLNLNEGPEFLKHDGHIFIIYSTRESWTPAYRLGQLRLKDSTNSPMDSKNWIKSGPVFQGNKDVLGVGHASFTTSPDGKEWWIMYHSKKDTKPGWERDVRLQQFTWKKDGSPDFGAPLPPGTLIKKPSGE